LGVRAILILVLPNGDMINIMCEPFVDLEAVFNYAFQETQKMIEFGFDDLSNPCIVTSLE
jgi:hypothetical protein